MSASSFTLDYELTRDDMQAAFERSRRQIRPSWIRRIGACFVIGIAFDGWQDHAWWFTAMLLLLGLELWTSPLWMDWVIRKFVSLPADPMHIQIEADDRSLRIHDASRPVGSRFWWSRLSKIEEREFGIELYFDNKTWSELQVPWKAFAGDEQWRDFVNLAERHSTVRLSPPPPTTSHRIMTNSGFARET